METGGRDRFIPAPRATPHATSTPQKPCPAHAAPAVAFGKLLSTTVISTLQQGRRFMDTTPLCVFVTKVTASNRIVFGDLRRLQRDVLPTGPATREEIEALLALDSLGNVDEDWPGYLV